MQKWNGRGGGQLISSTEPNSTRWNKRELREGKGHSDGEQFKVTAKVLADTQMKGKKMGVSVCVWKILQRERLKSVN